MELPVGQLAGGGGEKNSGVGERAPSWKRREKEVIGSSVATEGKGRPGKKGEVVGTSITKYRRVISPQTKESTGENKGRRTGGGGGGNVGGRVFSWW